MRVSHTLTYCHFVRSHMYRYQPWILLQRPAQQPRGAPSPERRRGEGPSVPQRRAEEPFRQRGRSMERGPVQQQHGRYGREPSPRPRGPPAGGAGPGQGAGGRGRGDGEPVAGRAPFEGSASASFPPNRKISIHQARWLQGKGRCFHCYALLTDCKPQREGLDVCPFKGASTPLAKGSFGGAPGWEP